MSDTQGTSEVITEQDFIEALLSIIECGYLLAFEACDRELFLVVNSRNDTVLLDIITDKATEMMRVFAIKVLAHHDNTDVLQEDALLDAAVAAALVSGPFGKILVDIETVEEYCLAHSVSSASFETAALLARALELGGRRRLVV